MATVTRVFEFDAAHRVMNERVKCYNLHGHRFKVEVEFSYTLKSGLGYAIDFKEIKRIAGGWIDDNLDHATILNPKDIEIIDLCKRNNFRLYIMGMGSTGDINPSAENLATELLVIIKRLLANQGVTLERVRLYETPNCWVDVSKPDYSPTKEYSENIDKIREQYGVVNYDIREQ